MLYYFNLLFKKSMFNIILRVNIFKKIEKMNFIDIFLIKINF